MEQKFTSYNINKFTDGSVNLLYLTGFSGSGKSTFAERLSYKYDIVNVTLDNLDPKFGYIYEKDFSEDNEIFYEFLDRNPELNEKIKRPNKTAYRSELFNKFFPFAEKWCKEHKEKKYVLEGVQIYEFPEGVSKNYPIIIMNTSAEESAKRKYKRTTNFNKEITSKENIYQLNEFRQSLDKEKSEESNMINMSDSMAIKILPITMDLLYKYRDNKTNNLGKINLSKDYKGLIALTTNLEDLVGYIIVKNHKLAALEVMEKYKKQNLIEKLIKYAIEKYDLNEINISKNKVKMIRTLQDIGFKIVSQLNDKVLLKLYSIITRKNNFEDLIVRRENGTELNGEEERFVYYFSKSSDGTPVARMVLRPSTNDIISVEMYKGFDRQKDLNKLLNFATIEKNCTNIRLPFGDKDKLKMYEKYGFEIVKKVRNSKGKFYCLELMDKEEFSSDEELMQWLEDNVTTCEFTTLMDPVEVEKQMVGSSHDQAQFILSKMPYKYNATAILVVEKNVDNKIVKANTIVTYRKNDKYYWIENCIENAIGINGPYDDLEELENDVIKKFEYINKEKDVLDFIPIYVTFDKNVNFEEYVRNIITLKG